MSKELIDSIIKTNIDKIIYISCNPATQARDLNLFKEHYDFSDIYPVDMFPFTTSCETVVFLSNKKVKDKDIVEIGIDTEDYYKIKKGK